MTEREIKVALAKVRALADKLDEASTKLSDAVAEVWAAVEALENKEAL